MSRNISIYLIGIWKTILPLVFIVAINSSVYSQTPDWSSTVATIIFNNCSSCHHNGGIGPFPIMNYGDAVANATQIKTKVLSREMPPWPADPAYRRFAYEALLDSAEIAAIASWVDNSTPLGNIALAPPTPVFSQGGSLLDTIHHTLQIPPYTLQSNNDVYRYFAFHSNYTDTVYINQIEVIPGLPHLVHHADIHFDLSGVSYYNDSISLSPGFSGGIASNYYMNAWQPGGGIAKYPPNWGIMVPPGADYVFEIHYGPGGLGQTDTTKMNLRFITNPTTVRSVKVGWLLNNPIPAQGPLVIPPNVVTTFNQVSAPMAIDRSLIAICPHMHMLGKSYKVWYISLTGDSVPLIDIPHWDFHWQKYYTFQKIQKIPAGARLYSVASFDNTTNNPHNPNNPPMTVYYGPTTEDEMLMTYFIYANYQVGDENIIMDSTLFSTSIFDLNTSTIKSIHVFPNPSVDAVYLRSNFGEGMKFDIRLTDMMGNLLIQMNEMLNDEPLKIDTSQLNAGMFVIHVSNKDHAESVYFIKIRQ